MCLKTINSSDGANLNSNRTCRILVDPRSNSFPQAVDHEGGPERRRESRLKDIQLEIRLARLPLAQPDALLPEFEAEDSASANLTTSAHKAIVQLRTIKFRFIMFSTQKSYGHLP